MHPNPAVADHVSPGLIGKLMNWLSGFTLAMTVPQVWSVWSGRHAGGASGVSIWSWIAYLLAAVVWLVYGLRKGDKHIYVPCIGWIVLDAAIVAGLLVNR